MINRVFLVFKIARSNKATADTETEIANAIDVLNINILNFIMGKTIMKPLKERDIRLPIDVAVAMLSKGKLL